MLGKVDADTEARVVQALQVQAVPTVFAVIGGRLVPGFEGVLPDDQLREFIGAVLQAAEQAGLAGPGVPAEQAEQAGDAPRRQCPRTPASTPPRPRSPTATTTWPASGSRRSSTPSPPTPPPQLALHQVDLLARVEKLGDATTDPAPDDVAGQLGAADLALVGGDSAAALRRLLDLITRTAGEDRETVRRRLLEYFDLLGPDDPLVGPARREMARALF